MGPLHTGRWHRFCVHANENAPSEWHEDAYKLREDSLRARRSTMPMKVRDVMTTSNPETVHPKGMLAFVSTLRALAMLAIAVGWAPAAARSAPPSSAKLSELDAPAEGCPYHFDSDMPADTFCVYRGVAWNGAGEMCATDVVVIWSSVASQAPASGGPAVEASASSTEVYVGFVADPELVVRAIADPRQGDHAEMVGYTLGSEEAPQPLAGQITLRAVHLGSADVLSINLREPRPFHPGSCTFASYSGTFLGMIRPPSERTASVD